MGCDRSQSTISTFTFSRVCRKFVPFCEVMNPNQRYLRSVWKGLDWDIEWVGCVGSQSTISTFTFSRVYRKFLPICEVCNSNQRYLRSVLKGLDWDDEWVGCDRSQSTLSTFAFLRVYRNFFAFVWSDQPQSKLSTFRFEGVRLRHWVSGVWSIHIIIIYVHFFEGIPEIVAFLWSE